MRGALEAQDLKTGQTCVMSPFFRKMQTTFPGDPTIVGIADANGDGKHDYGRVEVRVDERAACATVNERNDVGVESGACEDGSPSTTD
jgi:hypothetical protein